VSIVRAGRSLRIRDARTNTHLWFVLTDPDPMTGKVVLVMLVSERSHTERTVRLGVGDHPFIRHASNVDYGTATYAPVAKLEAALGRGVASLDADMSDDLLQRVRDGLLASSHAPHDVVEYCRGLFER
jgi:hypothetical protein